MIRIVFGILERRAVLPNGNISDLLLIDMVSLNVGTGIIRISGIEISREDGIGTSLADITAI